MPTDTEGNDVAKPLTPAGLSGRLPSRPVLSSTGDGWRGVVLQRYRHPPGTIDIPGLRDELLVAHLSGPILVEEGRGTRRFERRWIGPGQVCVTPAGQPVHRVLKGQPDVVLLHFAPEKMRAVAEGTFDTDPARVVLVPRFGVPDETTDRLIRLLLAEAEAPTFGTGLMTEALTRALLVHILRRHSNLSPRTPEIPAGMSAGRVRRVVDHMRAHMDEALPLAQLAQLGGLSPSRFARTFRDATGQPPHRFLVRLRIAQARELLEHTDLPVIEVGLRCGFEQPAHFAAMFRKATGLSPRAWRLERRA